MAVSGETPLRRSGMALVTVLLATGISLLPQAWGYTAGQSELLQTGGAPTLGVAHRGLSDAAPENTMPAFEQAIAAGAAYVELDIRLSSDGVPVVIHDAELDRTTDGTGAVSRHTLKQLRALDAGSWFAAEYRGTRIPTLDEVLDYLAGHEAGLILEFKGRWDAGDVDTVAALLHEHRMTEQTVIASFNEETLAAARLLLPELPRMLLSAKFSADLAQRAQEVGASAVGVEMDQVLRYQRRVAEVRSSGMAVFSFTANWRYQWRALDRAGVDGIISDRVQHLHEWMGEQAAG